MSNQASTPVPVPSRRLLTYDEVAAMFNVPTRMVRRLVDDRRLACVKVGRYVRIEEHEVLAFIERERRAA